MLALIREKYSDGTLVDIEQFNAEAKPLLYGASVRSYLSKLEEMGHLVFHTVENSDQPEPEGDAAKQLELDEPSEGSDHTEAQPEPEDDEESFQTHSPD